MTVESLSHLEAIFDNEDIKESVRKIKRAYKEENSPHDIFFKVQKCCAHP